MLKNLYNLCGLRAFEKFYNSASIFSLELRKKERIITNPSFLKKFLKTKRPSLIFVKLFYSKWSVKLSGSFFVFVLLKKYRKLGYKYMVEFVCLFVCLFVFAIAISVSFR